MMTILDCYTDEPSGLGVPPYIGTYPRYIAGKFPGSYYLTIDDIRFWQNGTRKGPKTDIKTYNLTNNHKDVDEILKKTDEIIIIIGVHTPGKYLSAVPGTLREIAPLLGKLSCKVTLAGPAIIGSQMEGGRKPEKMPSSIRSILKTDFSFDEIRHISVKGTSIISQIPDQRIAEIETGRGCSRNPGCSFCTEPIKSCLEFRPTQDIIDEVRSLLAMGIKDFRLGKQSCFYSYPDPIKLLKEIRNIPGVDILHIDNVNPAMVITRRGIEITKALVKYGSDGNVAAFGDQGK